MERDRLAVLVPAFSGFHQDFDLEEYTQREVPMRARGLAVARREPLYAALRPCYPKTSRKRASGRLAGHQVHSGRPSELRLKLSPVGRERRKVPQRLMRQGRILDITS